MPMKKLCFLLVTLFVLTLGPYSHAEKADASQPTNVEADELVYDDTRQTNTFTGNVILTRGSLTLKAGKMVVRQDADGYQYATLYAPPNGFATFRQKRNGGSNLWIEGRAGNRIEYDTKSGIAKFFNNAQIQLLDGQTITDQVQGDFISYDSNAEFYTVNNTTSGQSKPGAGRVRAVIRPRSDSKDK